MNVPLSVADFTDLMTPCGPFEPRPLLAVAVSGGADSLALALLAHEWARARNGRIVALTVDHGLRPEARAEARTVGRWMRQRGIAHRVLAWRGPKPKSGIQAAAREARYRLLTEWCRSEGALHLLVGHTCDDQAETVLLRLAAGSGPHGLAGMPSIQELAAARILRPLLGIARGRIVATLRARSQLWIEDPSNRDERFARIRVRRMLAAASRGGTHAANLARSAGELGRFRAGQERKVADVLARAVELRPEGYALLDAAVLAEAAPEIGRRALAALLATIGGLGYVPRGDAVRTLHAELCADRAGKGRTLAHCRLVRDGGAWLVVRETRGIESAAAKARALRGWDGRFDLTLAGAWRGTRVAALGAQGWAELVARAPDPRGGPLPYPARLPVPALWDRKGLVAVPALGWRRGPKKTAISAFRPRRPLVPAVFAALFSA